MRKIIFNKNKFFSTEDPPEDNQSEVTDGLPEQPEEPVDYLHGIPATVLDLKNPVFQYNEGELSNKINEDSGNDPEIQTYLPEWENNYRDVISNLNKESAINHRLNELGSTNYDLSGETSRKEVTGGVDSLEYAAADPKSSNEGEEVHIGAVSVPEKYRDSSAPNLKHNIDLGNAVAHELGHLNDRNMNESTGYGTKYTNQSIKDQYGNDFADAYSRFRDPFGDTDRGKLSLQDQLAIGHDKTPFEVYADASSFRSALFKSGAWDGREPITEDMVKNYLLSENDFLKSVRDGKVDYYPNDPNFNYGSTNQRMAQFFDVDDIVKILNSQRRYSISSDYKVRIFSEESEDDDPPNKGESSGWIDGINSALNEYLKGRSWESKDVDEPTDYLKGTPATVLDLKKPVFKFDPGDPTFGSDMSGYVNRTDSNKLKDIVSDLNKESAITHKLNELGATNYDLSGEGSRRVVIDSNGALASSAAAPNSFNWLETMFTGYKDKHGIDPRFHQDDVFAHELGHMNDSQLSRWNILNYGDKITLDDVKERYGDEFADAYKNYHGHSRAERHDHTPSEVYADAAAMRSALLKSGAWNGESEITPDMITDYLTSEREYMKSQIGDRYNWSGLPYGSPSQRLETQFDKDDIAKILNSSRRYCYTDEYLQDNAVDDDLTADTKEFIGKIEPNRPFHNRSTFEGKTLFR